MNCNPFSRQAACRIRRSALCRFGGVNVGTVSWLCPQFPASCPFRVVHIHSLPGAVSGTCFASANSLWPAPLAPPSPRIATHRNRCSKASQLLWGCQTSRIRTSLAYSFRIHSADLDASRPNAGSPGSRVSLFRACAGSSTTRGRNSSCDSELLRVAFRYYDGVGPPKLFDFRGSIPGPHVSLSTLRHCPCEQSRMTRDQCGSLLLHLTGLAPA